MKRAPKEVSKLPMVGWYDPGQLRRTGVQVAISTIFGQHADRRILQALADNGSIKKRYYYEVQGGADQEFWFDYISDVGDGFDPTYTMALNLTREQLDVAERVPDSPIHSTKMGKFVVFGGDEVYPIASLKDYKERLTDPYSAAFPKLSNKEKEKPENQNRPMAFGIPGNHDWYDSLVEFTNLFCTKEEFCGWDTIQNHSYFAIKLPRGWWLFGTDMQLSSSLDRGQIDYFEKVMEFVLPEDRIILCTPEPYWITEKMYEKDRDYINRNLGKFEGIALKRQTAINIAGDRHYYRHHEQLTKGAEEIPADSQSKKHKFVAGGGGAFLHPTHNEHVDENGRGDRYALRQSFPDERTSWRLTFWNLLFPIWNWRFCFITGALYLLTAQAFFASMGAFTGPFGWKSINTAVATFLSQPQAFFWVILIILGFLFFTDAHSKIYQRIAGPIHALVHLSAVFIIGWTTSTFMFAGQAIGSYSVWRILIAGILVFIVGGVVGSMIMGLYLLISLNVFSMHHNEAFSAIKIPDFKNFLRLRIAVNGDLTIYPVGVERVISQWEPYKSRSVPHIVPIQPAKETKPFLIEKPIKYKKQYSVPSEENSLGAGAFTIVEHEIEESELQST